MQYQATRMLMRPAGQSCMPCLQYQRQHECKIGDKPESASQGSEGASSSTIALHY